MSVEFTAGGQTYRAGKLDARRQFHVVRRIAPLMTGVLESGLQGKANPLRAKIAEGKPEDLITVLGDQDIGAVLKPVLGGLAALPEADADYVLNACLGVVERQQTGGGWARLMTGDLLQFEDLDMASMLKIAWEVLQHSLSGFFGTAPSSSPHART